jgi:DegV family protein with EDD domain
MNERQIQPGRPPVSRRPVAVVTDSATALPADLARAARVHVAAMEITIGGRTYEDGRGLTAEQFVALRSSHVRPQTAAPTPGVWLDRMREAAGEAESVLCVTLSAKLSAAHEAACTARGMAATEMPGVEVRVLDSEAAAGSEALVALAAARRAADGAGLDEVEREARLVAERVRLLAYLDTLEYVWRSGRVPRVAVWATSLLDVKPVMELYRGRIGQVARPRSRRRAADRIFAEVRSAATGRRSHVIVMHADAPDDAEALRERIRAELAPVELHLTPFAAFMAAHTGPGLVGVSYWCE